MPPLQRVRVRVRVDARMCAPCARVPCRVPRRTSRQEDGASKRVGIIVQRVLKALEGALLAEHLGIHVPVSNRIRG